MNKQSGRMADMFARACLTLGVYLGNSAPRLSERHGPETYVECVVDPKPARETVEFHGGDIEILREGPARQPKVDVMDIIEKELLRHDLSISSSRLDLEYMCMKKPYFQK
ncbi:hypothetical protein KY363_01845 [Candidatus Woesearchaeota archaeon]|nr:hypothetical protein [Candidatus Woesearchaeota archaeon]